MKKIVLACASVLFACSGTSNTKGSSASDAAAGGDPSSAGGATGNGGTILINAVSITANNNQTCAAMNDGAVQCWGINMLSSTATPTAITGITNALTVSGGQLEYDPEIIHGGRDHVCALLKDGGVQCWDGNADGELGTDPTSAGDYRTTPVLVSALNGSISVGSGGHHTCAVATNHKAYCWGNNDMGQLGNGSIQATSYPHVVTNMTNAVTIAAGGMHSCAILADGSVQCWGVGYSGMTTSMCNGANGGICDQVPITVPGVSNAVSISTNSEHTCAALSDGSVQCWGYNGNGQLGVDPKTTFNATTATAATGITNAVSVSVSIGNTCAALSDGSVQCWGDNTRGQLGNGTTQGSWLPVTVPGVTDSVATTSGYEYACALQKAGSIKCWGRCSGGQCGNGKTDAQLTPVQVLQTR